MSHFTPICHCCYDREEEDYDDDDQCLPDYDEEGPREMIESWLDLLEKNTDGVLAPLATYIKGGGADAIAKSPELRMRVITVTRLYIVANPSEENRQKRMEIYHAIKAVW
jgi:hypothetical protein